MDDLDKINKYEWYGIDGGYWYAGELIDDEDNPSDYWPGTPAKWFEAKDQMMHEVGQRLAALASAGAMLSSATGPVPDSASNSESKVPGHTRITPAISTRATH